LVRFCRQNGLGRTEIGRFTADTKLHTSSYENFNVNKIWLPSNYVPVEAYIVGKFWEDLDFRSFNLYSDSIKNSELIIIQVTDPFPCKLSTSDFPLLQIHLDFPDITSKRFTEHVCK
jgi:hypothetical protein